MPAISRVPTIHHQRVDSQRHRHEEQIAFVERAFFFETPFRDFLVAAALLHPFAQIAVIHPEEVATDGVSRSRRPEIFVIFFRKLAAPVHPDLVDHAREIHHPFCHLFRTLRIFRHNFASSTPQQRQRGWHLNRSTSLD